MNFFSTCDSRNYFLGINNKISSEINGISDEEIINCDLEEWKDYLYDKHYVEPIVIFEDNIEQVLDEKKIKQYNHWHKFDSYEKEFYNVDGYSISYKIYYDGNADLFELKPSTWIMSNFTCIDFERPKNKNCGSFTLEFLYTKHQLKEKQDLQDFIKKDFKNKFKNYRTMIRNVNQEVKSYNDSLKDNIMDLLIKRKEKASMFATLSKELEIPMVISATAPNIKPIALKRINRKPPQKPKNKPQENNYCISDIDYGNINNIILMNGTAMEKTAKTYFRNNEEELRDHLLATLNTHYENASGETFRKIGKTDILIEFENKAAFIGECKIWYGKKQLSETIQQILNYSTWKDVKSSVVIFNKKNKIFKKIIENIDSWVNENAISHSKPQINVWKCRYYREDMLLTIDITIHLFDIYVDENQFQDMRYE